MFCWRIELPGRTDDSVGACEVSGYANNHLVPCRQESIRTAFLLSQGGEFAFVLLSLANELKVHLRRCES